MFRSLLDSEWNIRRWFITKFFFRMHFFRGDLWDVEGCTSGVSLREFKSDWVATRHDSSDVGQKLCKLKACSYTHKGKKAVFVTSLCTAPQTSTITVKIFSTSTLILLAPSTRQGASDPLFFLIHQTFSRFHSEMAFFRAIFFAFLGHEKPWMHNILPEKLHRC